MDTNISTRPTINITPVKSSIMVGFGYDPVTQTLAVQFPPNKANPEGAIYHYQAVESGTFEEFQAAPSKGSFFISRIKTGGYRYDKLDPAPAPEATHESVARAEDEL